MKDALIGLLDDELAQEQGPEYGSEQGSEHGAAVPQHEAQAL